MKYRQEGDLYKKTTRFLNTRVEKLSFLFQHLEGEKEMRRKLVAMLTAATLVVGMLAGCDLSTAYYVSDYIATLYRGCLIEYGPAKQIMDNPAHPYTELLMSSVPRVGDKWDKEIAMPDMEGKEYAVQYCKFAPRCPYATDECRQKRPDEVKLGDERMVLCCHPLGQKEKEA